MHERKRQEPRNPLPTKVHRSVWIFFALVFLAAVPFYLLGARFGRTWAKALPITLPLSALMFVVPALVAALLTRREQGPAGVRALLRRAFDFGRIAHKRWYLAILGLWPALMLLEYGILTWIGVSLPPFEFPLGLVPVFFVAFFIGGIGEELGWTAYATDRLQTRYSALQVGLIIGVAWALLHVPADLQAHRTPTWILWQRLGTIVLRVLTVWLYNNTGRSTFATILFHDTVNMGMYMFSNYGSDYDPFLTLVFTTVLAVIVIALWGPSTLSRYRFGPSHASASGLPPD
jgi:membrane protease YdiL (CAAX protease family)